MIEHQGIYLPDGETHLTGWMDKAGEIVDGKGTYQIKKLRAALTYCKRFRTALDVGSHVGMWTMQLAKKFEHVHAFEPVLAHRECFAMNVDAINVTLHPIALGKDLDRISITTGPNSSGDSWVSGPGDIEMMRLDDFDFDDVDFIKVDTEGSELPILVGGEQTIKRCLPTIIVEQKPGHAQRFGLGETAAIPYLQSLGYVLRQEISGDFILTV